MKKTLIVAFASSLLLSSAYGESHKSGPFAKLKVSRGNKLKSIQIEGNKRIESQTIYSYLPIKEGEPLNADKLDECLKALFNTGYFSDVKVFQKNDVMIIQVVENPIINQIAYEGNSKLKDDVLQQELKLRPREVLSRARIQEAQQRILEIYRRMGRFSAKVEPKIINLPENRVDLVFEIDEGEVTYIQKINFIGNENCTNKKLEEQLISKRTRWYRFFAVDDVHDPDRFMADQQALRKFYYDNGFPDFRIISAHAELSPDRKEFFLNFHIEEGHKYSIGKIDITSDLPNIKIDELKENITFNEGDDFSGKQIEKTITKLTDAVGNQGYAFVSIEPDVKKDPETKKVDITFQIKEGPRVYIEKVIFSGNDRTRDHVLRREMEVSEGDAFNSQKLRNSEQRLKDLGYFKNVSLETEAGSAPDQARVVVKVEEQSTGELGLAGGFSTMDGFLVQANIVERNFMGTGRIVHTDLSLAKKRQDFDIGIIEPYFMGRNLTASFDVFRSRMARFSAFKQNVFGFNVGFSYPLSEKWAQSFTYSLRQDRITHVSVDASEVLKQQKGNFLASSLTHTLSYDTRDSRRLPTSGYIISMSNTYSGLGGNVFYLKNTLSASWFKGLAEDVILNVRGEVGGLERVGKKDIRIVDSFMLGADSFRGFEFGGIGPRDAKTKDALGGTRFWTSTVEVQFPLGLPNEFGVKGAVFTDLGSLWRPGGKQKTNVLSSNKMRASVGFGVSWDSPFGPIRIDYAKPIKKTKYDEEQRVLVGFSTRF